MGFKCVLVGDGAVGKTTLRNQYLGEQVSENYMPTLGANFAAKKISRGDQTFQWQIWDIAGQVSYKELRRHFYQGSMGCLVLYDITSRNSFSHVIDWLEESWINSGRGPIPTIIIANKNDLRGTGTDEVTSEEGRNLAKKLSKEKAVSIAFLETSALKGFNVDRAFLDLADAILERFSYKVKVD